jgi:hypothetical protein
MFPKTSEAWIFISVACVIGFIIGQWLKHRRNKVDKNDEYVNGLKKRILAEQLAQTKKGKKQKRKGNKKNGDSLANLDGGSIIGKWTVLNKKSRKIRNPQVGVDLTIDARKVISFKSSPVLRNALMSGG